MSIFEDWSPRELCAMRRALGRLHADQPINSPAPIDLTCCYYSADTDLYFVDVFIRGKRFHCGTMREWSNEKAARMQNNKKAEHGGE